ncbi:hypothetical protein C8F01DRAFT_488248 [Mycena amicta]|nr:hypothetical protein C8F01DRAFT_488248 [Mycena amicta]
MLAYDVEVAKLFSPVGVVYIKRDKTELPGTLHLSKTYDDLDGDIKRTAACILWAHNRQTSWDASASSPMARIEASLLQWLFSLLSAVYLAGLWCWGIQWCICSIHPREESASLLPRQSATNLTWRCNITALSFTTKLAFGARGTVMRSAGGSEVIKLFWNEAAARREVFFLESCTWPERTCCARSRYR